METATKTDTKTSNSKAAANLIQPKAQEQDKNGIEGEEAMEAVGVQAKLSIGRPGDKYEQEADAVADKVVSMPDQSPVRGKSQSGQVQQKTITTGITPWVQKQTADRTVQQTQSNGKEGPEKLQLLEEEDQEKQVAPKLQLMEDDRERLAPKLQLREDEETAITPKPIQTKRFSPESTSGSSLEDRLNKSKGGGSALPDDTRSFMESRIGADFSQVKVHTGSDAVQMNKELGAQAFTHGNNVYFNQGKYDPGSNSGKKLLAHELTHTVQQGGESSVRRFPAFVGEYAEAVRYNSEKHKFNYTLIRYLYLVSGDNSLWQAAIASRSLGIEFAELVAGAQAAMGKHATGKLDASTVSKGLWYLRRVKYNRAKNKFNRPFVWGMARLSGDRDLFHKVDRKEFLGAEFVRLTIAVQRVLGLNVDGYLGPSTKKKIAKKFQSEGLSTHGMEGKKLIPGDTFPVNQLWFAVEFLTGDFWLSRDEKVIDGNGKIGLRIEPNFKITILIPGTFYLEEFAIGIQKDIDERKYERISQWVHTALDLAGMVPVVGIFADGANVLYYVIKGEFPDAAIAAFAMVPIFGTGATLTKNTMKIPKKTVDEMSPKKAKWSFGNIFKNKVELSGAHSGDYKFFMKFKTLDLNDESITWLIENPNIKKSVLTKLLSESDKDIINSINLFFDSMNFHRVLNEYASSSDTKVMGAEFILKFASNKIRPPVNFELYDKIGARGRFTDIKAFGISYELKSVKRISKKYLDQFLYDVVDRVQEIGKIDVSDLRWVFDSRKITKEAVIKRFKKILNAKEFKTLKVNDKIVDSLEHLIILYP
ncbi:MAG: DUF4157 domain-containing protein [Reichenbachiella sp.]|uniref:eCIS core domain-containing protein n=1 Tax=Reichenbachiella sp. TaxID=2184521 RepID=UPI00326482FD